MYNRLNESPGNIPPTKRQFASNTAVFGKWIVSVIIALIFLTCLLHTKLTFFALSESLNMNTDLDRISRSRIYVMLQLIAIAPHVINIIRGVWSGLLRSDRKWPSKKRKFVLATFISILESFGLCMFIFCIPGHSKAANVILLMNCAFFFPLLDNIRSVWKLWITEKTKGNRRFPYDILVNILALILELVGIALTIVLHIEDPLSRIWTVPVGILCLSISWTPSVQKYIVETEINVTDEPQPSTSSQTTDEEPTRKMITESATWKLTAWMSFVKLISTIGFSMLIYFTDSISPLYDALNEVNVPTYVDGWLKWRECSNEELINFTAHISEGFIGYVIGYIACTTRSQRLGYIIPIMAANPLSVILLSINFTTKGPLRLDENQQYFNFTMSDLNLVCLVFATVLLVLAQILSVCWLLFKGDVIVMLAEDQLFWTPMYNSILLDQWIMITRRNKHTDPHNVNLNPRQTARRSRIFICTTMYRENDVEMRQLLESLKQINDRVSRSRGLQFESHIFFDGAVKDNEPNEFVSQLQSLVDETFDTSINGCMKVYTPYGMCRKWRLRSNGIQGMDFIIHLKDNTKVKSKKRWSQVMYMRYITKFHICAGIENYDQYEVSYILTTDADVHFTPDNVEALLDCMTLDKSVGAVCARTHPLGQGPVVWYQKFEYALGHWFQKEAEHVFGSVLCAPGCFSVYRCKAIKEVLKSYSSNVERAEDFLTRDMGEDRWLCSLLIQKGWRIEYCAASENSTYCPQDFDDFFKQRRRWVASTLANLWLLVKEWKKVKTNNQRVSYLFLVYQMILLFAALIAPSSIILVITGGLKYGIGWNPVATMLLQLLSCVCFAIICVTKSPQKIQLSTAKVLAFFYAILMVIALVGTAIGIATDFTNAPSSKQSHISEEVTISTASVYLFFMTGLILLAACLHAREMTVVLYGIVYLLFLPSGQVLLTIYSICNLDDISWGTRERTEKLSLSVGQWWKMKYHAAIRILFPCASAEFRMDEIQPSGESVGTQFPEYKPEERLKVKEDISKEAQFWKRCLEGYRLIPCSTEYSSGKHLNDELRDLRNRWLLIFAMVNIMWLVLITSLADQGEVLNVFGSNPVGFVVIALFAILLLVQFFAMIIHRISTLMHFLGRTPYKCNSAYNGSWMFAHWETLDAQAARVLEEDRRRAEQRNATRS